MKRITIITGILGILFALGNSIYLNAVQANVDLSEEMKKIEQCTATLASLVKKTTPQLIGFSALSLGCAALMGSGAWVLKKAFTSNDEESDKNFNRNLYGGISLVLTGGFGIGLLTYLMTSQKTA